MQVLPCFDVFWKLHRQARPDLSIFFTNHVASMLHRFWGDWVPTYVDDGYAADAIHSTFVLRSMDLFDRQLGRIMRWQDANPDAHVIIASALGQAGIPYAPMEETYVLTDATQLLRTLGFHEATVGPAMYPRVTVLFEDQSDLEAARSAFEGLRVGSLALFRDPRAVGRSLSMEIAYFHGASGLPEEVTDEHGRAVGSIADLGIEKRARPGGGNTAQHVPEGVLLARGPTAAPSTAREQVSILDVAPTILRLLSVQPDRGMRGRPLGQFRAGPVSGT
jgi:hypothetical protein